MADPTGPPDLAPFGHALKKHIDAHGHAFQARVLSQCEDLPVDNGLSWEASGNWRVAGVEVPVLDGDDCDFKIDIVLQFWPSHRTPTRRFAVIECKRVVNQAWGFIRRTDDEPVVVADRVHVAGSHGSGHRTEPIVYAQACQLSTHTANLAVVMDLGIELPLHPNPKPDTDSKASAAENSDKRNGIINGAVTQSIRALAGWTRQLSNVLADDERGMAVPMVVTNAPLYVTEMRLAQADASGRLPSIPEVTPRPWLWLAEQISETQLPDVGRKALTQRDLQRVVLRRNTRGVLIVHEPHLADALRHLAFATGNFDPLPD